MNDNENTTIHCHNAFVRRRLAGEKFIESPRECYTGKADDDGYCRGAGYGQSCANSGDADCDVDLYCSEKQVCEYARLNGEYCNEKLKCASYLTCAWEDGVNYKCRPYGFHQDGKQLGPGDEEDLCRSRHMNDEYICEKAPWLTHSNVVDYPGHKCVYTHGSDGVAQCYYHHEGKAICRRGNHDMRDEWQIVLEYLKRKPKCHVALPYAQCDEGRKVFETDVEWHKTWLALNRLHWEHQMEGLNECMKHFIHPEAFKYEVHKSYGSYMGFTIIGLISMILLVL